LLKKLISGVKPLLLLIARESLNKPRSGLILKRRQRNKIIWQEVNVTNVASQLTGNIHQRAGDHSISIIVSHILLLALRVKIIN